MRGDHENQFARGDRATAVSDRLRFTIRQPLLLAVLSTVLAGCAPSERGEPSAGPPASMAARDFHVEEEPVQTADPSPVTVDVSMTQHESDWTPRAPLRDWTHIVLHHSATASGSVESFHQQHLRRTDTAGRPWLGIGYHFVIGNGRGMEDGQVEPTFRWREQLPGAHAGVEQLNRQGIGICLVGNFDEHPPTAAQRDAAQRLVFTLASEYDVPAEQIIGHGDVRATACPGRLFPLNEVVAALATFNGPNVVLKVSATRPE